MTSGNQDRSARQAKIAAAAPKESRLKPIIGLLVVLLAVAAVAGAIWAGNRDTQVDDAQSSSGRAHPRGATGDAGGIVINTKDVPENAPTLDIYEDFQCPICKVVHEQLKPALNDLVQTDKIRVVLHMTSFMDQNLKNTGSYNATLGAACAADQGKFVPFHSQVFAIQSQEEKVGAPGYTPEQIQGVAAKTGLQGKQLEAWQKCVSDKQYDGYVRKVEEDTAKAGVRGTPTYRVNGKDFDFEKQQVTSADDFKAKVLKAAGLPEDAAGAPTSPAPSASKSN